jgi:4-hydroxy-3-methylbut-2-enyl diphosphate reductase
LVSEVIAAARERFDVTIEEVKVTDETIAFKLPPSLSGEDVAPHYESLD